MQLEELRVEGYQSFSDTGPLVFKSGFNLIIGQNNSGKSALLRAITAGFADDRHRNEDVWETAKIPMPKACYKISVELTEFKDWIFMISPSGVVFPVPADDLISAAFFFESLSQFTVTMNKYAGYAHFQIETDPCHGLFERADFPNSPALLLSAKDGEISKGFGYAMGEGLSQCFWYGWTANMFYFEAERMALGESAAQHHPRLARNAENLPIILNKLQGELTPPRGFRHLFGESVRLSFWFVGGGQGPLSGAIA